MDDRQLLQEIFEYIRDDSKCTGMHFCIDDHSFMCGLSKKSIADMLKMIRNDKNTKEMKLYNVKKNLYWIDDGVFTGFHVETINSIPLDFKNTEDKEEEPWYAIRRKFPQNIKEHLPIIFNKKKLSLKGHKTIPKYNPAICQLENSVRKMW